MVADRLGRSDVWRKHCSRCPQRNGGEAPPRLTRGRRPGACEHCFQSKVACDRAEPCGRCHSRQLTCSYRRDRQALRPASGGRKRGEIRWQSGTMFLLSLTDPASTNMLESFTDEEPSDIGSENASTVAVEDVSVPEDDIFLQSLCDFVFDPMPVVSDSAGHRPVAPIFRAEAYQALQPIAEQAFQDLQDLHFSLISNDISYSELFPDANVKQALSPDGIIAFATTYFKLTHHHIPIIHRLSFGTADTAPALLLAVALSGALRSPPRDDALCVRTLARLFEEFIFLRLETTMATYGPSATPLDSKWLLETLQAAILVHNVQFMVNDVVTRRRLRTRRLPILVSTVRRLGPFSTRRSPDADGIQSLYEESCIRYVHAPFLEQKFTTKLFLTSYRIGLWTAQADWHHSILFHLPPLVSVSELTGDMPDMKGFWDADYIPFPGAKYEQHPSSGIHGPRSIRDCIRALMQEHISDAHFETLRGLSMSNIYLIILGMFLGFANRLLDLY